MFDLDGTILTHDSTARWIAVRLRRSPLRWLVSGMVAVLALPLLAVPQCRKVAGSMLLWVASFGMDEAGLHRSFAAFADELWAGKATACRQGAIARLKCHVAEGDRIVVVTAAPLPLAQAIVGHLGIRVVTLGSRLERRAGGWVLADHCRNRRKCAALAEAGYGSGWSFAYSDSLDDLPLLEGAEHPFLVNASSRTRRYLRGHLPPIAAVCW
ncbi:haloacid dehalogenase-like hydrolase [Novosphingobium sp. 18052]|nr:haloacid dehalogenase-like hydrolase [Novosphingobium sp. 18052]